MFGKFETFFVIVINKYTDLIRESVGNLFRYPAWLTELRNRLLQEGDNSGTMDMNVTSEAQKTHRRTVSDIPMFDDDNVRNP